MSPDCLVMALVLRAINISGGDWSSEPTVERELAGGERARESVPPLLCTSCRSLGRPLLWASGFCFVPWEMGLGIPRLVEASWARDTQLSSWDRSAFSCCEFLPEPEGIEGMK